MIHLITGKPGHGKNIYALHFLESENFITYDKDDKKFSATIDRPLYFISFTDIDVIDSTTCYYKDLDKLPTTQESENESIFVENSVIVIDEAHLCAPKSSNKNGFSNLVSFLKIHRHYGFDFIFITQSQKDLNIDIRNLVEYHYRVNRPFGTNKSFVNKFQGCETSEQKTPANLSTKSFKLDPRFFDIYKSATAHNYKSDIPRRYFLYIFLFLLFIIYVGSKFTLVYDAFFSEESTSIVSESLNILPEASTLDLTKLPVKGKNSLLIPYFYNIKNGKAVARHIDVVKAISPNVVFSNSSVFCYCNSQEINILDQIFPVIDIASNIKVDFILTSFDEADYLDYTLKYKFSSDFFKIGDSSLIPTSFLFNYLEKDYKSLKKITSSAFVEAGSSFETNIVTKFPTILKSQNTSRSEKSVKKKKDDDSLENFVSEKINFNDVGFKFKLKTRQLNEKLVSLDLIQSHSTLLKLSKDDVPITTRRDFKSSFVLSSDILMPLFTLSDLLNTSNKEQKTPFFDFFGFLPDEYEKSKSSYQIFLKFKLLPLIKPITYAQKIKAEKKIRKQLKERVSKLIANRKKLIEQKEYEQELQEYDDEEEEDFE